MTKTIHDILREFREDASSERDKGTKFEQLIAAYLKTDPQYADLYSNVWMWSEWPKGKGSDVGIDLVAEERYTGGLCAIQCKFLDPSYSLQKGDIDSFFTASGKLGFTSRMIVCTTDHWGQNAEQALENQSIPVSRLRVQDLDNSPVDWSKFSLRRPQEIKLREKKKIRPHQGEAIDHVKAGFKKNDRGKLIMACGTGKTFTALRLAEDMVGVGGHVLFLVPSLSLMSQSLREWTAESEIPLRSFAVCSDVKVGQRKTDEEDIQTHDLAFPATTNAKQLAKQLETASSKKKMNVVFSTYQSIKAVSEAQKKGAPDFDLIICDEAHRTTGYTVEGGEDSHFVKIHDAKFIGGSKRLYMTATPRVYSDDSKSKAKEAEAPLWSMDNIGQFGEEFHRLDFSEAVGKGLLTDYKVMVLAVDEKHVSKVFQAQLADDNRELKLEDYAKIVGCWNGLSKRFAPNTESTEDMSPMRRAVAFCSSIKASEKIRDLFGGIITKYRDYHSDDYGWLDCSVDHVDGTMDALERAGKLDWLKADTSGDGNQCRILSNARCLAEGVDVPALDAVMFLNPRNSVIDVVQSVGRVMRKSPGKKFGYIILPIGIPADMEPEKALADHQKYKVVWQVLQALRAHDDRFNATVNQIELNKKRPDQIQIIGVGGGPTEDGGLSVGENVPKAYQLAIPFPHIEEWKDAIYAKIVLKCGEREYWAKWAKDVAKIAESHISRIKALLTKPKPKHRKAFDDFLNGLRQNLNPGITETDAIEMLAQHLITKPVFDALFEGYDFTKSNPVSIAMQKMLDLLEEQSLAKEQEQLTKFYASVRQRASGVDNADGKQTIIKELYEEFFKTAFPRVAERQGIVYTPIEVVDFIVKSADEALRKEFGVGLTDKGVHVLDPFTGTGTFMVRLLQNGLIQDKDLQRKFREELHANEIILLAYYIAAINIEETYHDLKPGQYEPFEGIVLTDTFQSAEGAGTHAEMFPENNERLGRQKKRDIRVIVGNPPYSALQESENDSNKNQKYPGLDGRIRETYAKYSTAVLKSSLYDSYIRAFRWASDRIGKSGLICYITNGSYIDGNAMDGFRKCLAEEFTSIHCFNLRGNARTSGEQRRKEKGNVFGEGTRTPVAIVLLVKNPEKSGPCQLHYHDVGDYLSREEKLKIIKDFGNYSDLPWKSTVPNESHDWINQRDPKYATFISLAPTDDEEESICRMSSNGLKTNRDSWVYNFSKKNLSENVKASLSKYESELKKIRSWKAKAGSRSVVAMESILDNDPTKISWSSTLKNDLFRLKEKTYRPGAVRFSSYRPFCRQWVYFGADFNDRVGQMEELFPNGGKDNLTIVVSGPAAAKEFSALITDTTPNFHFHDTGVCFPLQLLSTKRDTASLPGMEFSTESGFNIQTSGLEKFGNIYGRSISEEDLFYYCYGILHSPEFKFRFSSDLKKNIPRIPFASDFIAFSKAGRELAKWHLNYETVEPFPLKEGSDELNLGSPKHFKVSKMLFGKRIREVDKTTIIYNSHITLSGIPQEAYEYVVNGRPAIEWIMERYQVTTEKDSGITNDPNDWSKDPRYIIDLVKRIVRVSIETMKIVKGLPPLNEKK